LGGLLGNKRASLGNLRKSKSSTTADNHQSTARQAEILTTMDLTMKRRSTGCLRRASVYSNKSTNTTDISVAKVNILTLRPFLGILVFKSLFSLFISRSGDHLDFMKFQMYLVVIVFLNQNQ
jgi:hypothetical protein